MRAIYREIIKYASTIYYIVPGMKDLLMARTGESFYRKYAEPKLVYLPNIVDCKHPPVRKKEYKRNELLTVLRMTKESVRRKNIKRLIIALSGLKDMDWKLNIIGDGEYYNKIVGWTEQYKIRDRINFLGKVNNEDISSYYCGSGAFILPSLMESFGMVYAESLLCGTPILYSRGVLGFEGVFKGVGAAVDPWSVESIQEGIRDILNENEKYRDNIKQLAESGSFNIFKPEYIGKRYIGSLQEFR
jgi:glycosyltransferase involved in cell wall biosynthesis